MGSHHDPPAATNKRRQPHDTMWEAHKETMELYYLTKNYTLQDTMTHMKTHHDFDASRKMYTQRFKDWGFVKNIKRGEAKLISRERRKRGSKLTETRVRNTVLAEARVARSISRHQKKEAPGATDMPTPSNNSDIIVATPDGNSTPSTPAVLNNGSALAVTPTTDAWTPSYATHRNGWSDADMAVARPGWRNMSHDELRQLKLDASRAYADGNDGDAEHMFRDALSGFRHTAGLTDKHTLKTAYQLASLYANLSRMEDANKVLRWALDSHIKKWSLDHLRTIAHLIQVVELHHFWSEKENAVALIRVIFKSLGKYFEKGETRTAAVGDGHGDNEDESRTQVSGLEHDTSFNDEAETVVDLNLHITGVWLDFGNPTLQQLLGRLITQSEKHPEYLTMHALKARLMLLKLHKEQQQLDTAFAVAKDALPSILRVVSEQDIPLLSESLEISLELAFFYLENGNSKGCEKILSCLADKLERGIVKRHCNGQLVSAALFFELQIACRHHQRDGGGWGNSGPWFERAYMLVIGIGELKSRLGKRLEGIMNTRGLGVDGIAISQETEDFLLSILA